ncbi:putative bifunctional protein [Moraxella macacae 0408225]|uniref:Putative bifunctional protein n=1 Tax=Moraxella macacae 0408225 TaxID=1230338 RepID=L2F6D0_9GAMM|nr:LysM peptidoglycan-binding domain-containing protein [Moraxella macacae]ELA08604.1 putative bifunctional protein [Moraxella macacae 0408225]
MFDRVSLSWLKVLTVAMSLGVSTLGFGASTYRVKAGDTLSSIANQYDLSIQELQNINNLKSANDIKVGDIVLLSDSTAVSYAGKMSGYTVQAGDTISSIVKKFDTTPAVLAELNPVLQSNYNQIVIGQKLIVPVKTTTTATATMTATSSKNAHTSKNFAYKIKSGDTFWGIANRFNISVNDLAELNEIDVMTRVQEGKTLLIPETAENLKKLANTKTSNAKIQSTKTIGKNTAKPDGKLDVITYTVQKGDNLGKLAQRYNVKLSALAEINGLATTSQVKIGQNLVIPVIK